MLWRKVGLLLTWVALCGVAKKWALPDRLGHGPDLLAGHILAGDAPVTSGPVM